MNPKHEKAAELPERIANTEQTPKHSNVPKRYIAHKRFLTDDEVCIVDISRLIGVAEAKRLLAISRFEREQANIVEVLGWFNYPQEMIERIVADLRRRAEGLVA